MAKNIGFEKDGKIFSDNNLQVAYKKVLKLFTTEMEIWYK